VSAEPVLKTSADAIALLKLEEGFSEKPYWDYAQWTVGYGTKCPDSKLAQYKQNGITPEEAEMLLNDYIIRYETELNSFMERTGVVLNQNQFDALFLFSYNCGTAWAYSTAGVFYNAIVKGATGNELINAFSRWCNAGGQIQKHLLRRRLCEANLYLNGEYSQKAPDNFGYVLYDPCGGKVSPNVQGYNTELTATIAPTPQYGDYEFAGWYTQKIGGTEVTVLDSSVRNARLYAHWLDGEGNDPVKGEQINVTVTVTRDGVNIRKGPGTDTEAIGKANTGDQMVVTHTVTGGSLTWGEFDGGWICLKYTDYDIVTAPEQETPQHPTVQKGTVKVNNLLNVRSGPSTGYSIVGKLKNGTKVEILEQKIAGTMVWGKIENGWISMDYVVLDPVKDETASQPDSTEPAQTEPTETKPVVTEPTTTAPAETEPPTTEPVETEPPTTEPLETEPPTTEPDVQKPVQKVRTGIVKVSDRLRVRSGPDVKSGVVGYLYPNEKVTVTEQASSGSMTWGKISKGWVSMDYIVLDPIKEEKPVQTKLTGKVNVKDVLRIRKGPGTSYAIAGYLPDNTKVEITERKTVGSTLWGKITKGWISLDYVTLNTDSKPVDSAPKPVKKTVTASCLRIRSAAGVNNKIVGYLYEGAKVEILESKKVGNDTWGRIAKGWISMSYVK